MKARGWLASRDTAAAAHAALARHVDLTRFEDARTDVGGMSIYFKSARAPERDALTIDRGNGGNADVDEALIRVEVDAAILRQAALGDVHVCHHFQT